MPGDEYASVGGGSLKLKGVKGSKVDKQRKKKSKKHTDVASSGARPADRPDTDDATVPAKGSSGPDEEVEATSDLRNEKQEATDFDEASLRSSTKTAAELRHEERRRKMLDERLKREGVKTHKERVEELNKYLSGLSEHHDMPKIGPG